MSRSRRLSIDRLVNLALFTSLMATVAPAVFAAETTLDLPDEVTFSEHVAPILFENCVSCHRPGDVAPMSLLTYKEARPWAKSIRQATSARDMPPWDADPRYGRFSNDSSLSEREIALLARWVELGAPEGDPSKMPSLPDLPEGWKMGEEPDHIVELAQVDVPADGDDVFMTQVYGLEVPAGTWLRAIELLPGNTEVLHHVVTYLGPFGMSDDEGEAKPVFLNELAKRPVRGAEAPSVGAVWVAGSPPTRFREGTGHSLKSNQLLTLNMHYHPNGTAGSDVSRLGLYFGEGELEKELTTAFAADPGMWIPAGVADHREEAIYLFSQDSQLLSFLPHLHQRGKSMKYTLERPDGSREILLSVPKYDYDWQNIYYLEEPVPVAAGSVLHVEAHWDNSAANPANPDSTLDVPWGDGTNNEMLVGFFDFIVDEGQKPRPVGASEKVAQLLEREDAASAYAISIEGFGFGGNWGLVVPPAGEGRLYMVLNTLMFSSSIPDILRLGDEIVLNADLITSGGGTNVPLAFVAKKTGHEISGEMFMGRVVTADNLESLRGQGRPFAGSNRLAVDVASGGAGR